ncbi:hypothetical protein [Bradyrhizobium australiense]|uniref:Uncharacterized protein n=1 Tax=Bradyrhizobium australiense TaxID=2721161 RepID=A0A7Y4GQV2_9BRAD|nr:hypothetical protein [Bradyrhizobium australiense]NOJ40300.1 hypothetical protein [Bradyrhizobium australiense]
MPDAQLTNKLSLRHTVRFRCPMCRADMEVLRVVSGRPGFEQRTLRCGKCGLIQEVQAAADPINTEGLARLGSSLRPPQ